MHITEEEHHSRLNRDKGDDGTRHEDETSKTHVRTIVIRVGVVRVVSVVVVVVARQIVQSEEDGHDYPGEPQEQVDSHDSAGVDAPMPASSENADTFSDIPNEAKTSLHDR